MGYKSNNKTKLMLWGAWSWIAEPRMHSVLVAASYACVATISGVFSLIDTSDVLLGTLGAVPAVLWPGLYIVTGLLGVPGALLGQWWLERAGIAAFFFSTVMVFVGITGYPIIHAEVVLLIVGSLSALSFMYAKRYDHIRYAQLDPSRLLRQQ